MGRVDLLLKICGILALVLADGGVFCLATKLLGCFHVWLSKFFFFFLSVRSPAAIASGDGSQAGIKRNPAFACAPDRQAKGQGLDKILTQLVFFR